MIILKYTKTKMWRFPKIKHVCTCGTKVLLDDLTDIIYTNHWEIDFFDRQILMFGYICPCCDSFVKLNKRNSHRVYRYLKKKGIDMDAYKILCQDLKYICRGSDKRVVYDKLMRDEAPLPYELYKEFVLK